MLLCYNLFPKCIKFTFFLNEPNVCSISQEHNRPVCKYSHKFSMKFNLERRCIPPITLEMFLQLHWSPSAGNSVDRTRFAKAHGCLYKVPQLTVHVRAQTRREVKGIACKYLRQVCLEAEIGGSVQKHICRFKGCSEHSGRRHQQVEEVEKHASSSWPAIQNEWSDKKTRRWISWWIPKWWDGSVQNSGSLYSTSSQNNLELREAKLKALELHWRLDNLDRSDVAGRF